MRRNSSNHRARSWLAAGAGAVLIGFLAQPVTADILYLFAKIEGAQAVPPTPSPGTGAGNLTLDTAADTLDFHITFQNLLGNETAAHFHGPAAPGQNAGVVFGLPLGSPKVGTWNYPAAQEANIINGLLYTNIHSTMFPGGEIRGQMLVVAESVCWGDGSGTACPCGNAAGAGEGCRNSSGAGGVVEPSGSNSVGTDDMSFTASNLLANQPALLFVGNTILNGGSGVPFGDGLRCVGVSVVRLGVMVPDAAGGASWGPGLRTLGGWNAGDSRGFQCWYRNPGGPCASGFNLTNAIATTFAP